MSYCNVVIVGRLAQDPDVKFGKSGKPWATFAVCYEDGWGDNKKAVFLPCKVWGKAAEAIGNAGKGDQVVLDGSIRYDEWEKDGHKRKEAYLSVSQWQYVGGSRREKPVAKAAEPAVVEEPAQAGDGDALPF